jgi:hypothetical protein
MKGGARNRSGPAADPNSGRSDRRGFSLTALPAEGYGGPVPDFPLPAPSSRELEVWEQAWRTPQACAWSMPSESWRVPTVALWVRTKVRCEAPDAGAALLGQLHRFSDQIGMTTAGLAEMGWKVAVDEVSKRGAEKPAEAPRRSSSRDRLKAVSGNGG